MDNEQAIQTGPPKHLLSLDGGGVKGVSSVMIHQAIMKEIQNIEDGPLTTVDQTKPDARITTSTVSTRERKPIDYFDLTGGTSTGGIIAVMISRLGMSCTEAINVYKQISKTIFAVRIFGIDISDTPVISSLGPLVLKLKTLFGSQYSAKYIDQSVDDIIKPYPLPGQAVNAGKPYYLVDDSKYDTYDAKGKMLMCATMANRGKALLFRNYTPPGDAIPESKPQYDDRNPPPAASPYPDPCSPPSKKNKNPSEEHLHNFIYRHVTIKEAIRATSAAPTYFPAKEIQKIVFWDGGCLNNNPIDQVWNARYDLAPTCHTEPYVQTVISIGATYTQNIHQPPAGPIARLLRILNKSLDFMTNTEAKHKDFKRNIYRRNLRQPKDQQTNYFRFNAPVGTTAISLADYKKIPLLIQKTDEYLRDPETICKIRCCAELLAKKKK